MKNKWGGSGIKRLLLFNKIVIFIMYFLDVINEKSVSADHIQTRKYCPYHLRFQEDDIYHANILKTFMFYDCCHLTRKNIYLINENSTIIIISCFCQHVDAKKRNPCVFTVPRTLRLPVISRLHHPKKLV